MRIAHVESITVVLKLEHAPTSPGGLVKKKFLILTWNLSICNSKTVPGDDDAFGYKVFDLDIHSMFPGPAA